MRIIDKKGKLFGKLNIIDLIAIILIVAVILLLGHKWIGNKTGASGKGGEQVVYTVKVTGVDAKVYESIQNQLPSQLMSSGDLLNGYVTKVEATPSQGNTFKLETNNDYGSETITRVDDGTYDLVFTVEATLTNAATHELGTQEVRVGKTHIVKTATFELANGVILSCESKSVSPQ